MHPILFNVGGWPVYAYGVLLAAAYLAGLQMAVVRARQRGLADKNLSLLAWRSQRIIDRVRCVRSDDTVPSFIEWSAKLSPDESVG